MASASLVLRSGGVTASSLPWRTRTGQRTRLVSSTTSLVEYPGASAVSMSVSGVVSSPQVTQSSMTDVECGSVHTCEKKNRRNSS